MPSMVMEKPTNQQDKTDTSRLPEVLGTFMFCSLLLTLSSSTVREWTRLLNEYRKGRRDERKLEPLSYWMFISNQVMKTELSTIWLSNYSQKHSPRDFPAVRRFKTLPSSAGCVASIPGGGTKITQARWHGQKEKKTITEMLRCEKRASEMKNGGVWPQGCSGKSRPYGCCQPISHMQPLPQGR